MRKLQKVADRVIDYVADRVLYRIEVRRKSSVDRTITRNFNGAVIRVNPGGESVSQSIRQSSRAAHARYKGHPA